MGGSGNHPANLMMIGRWSEFRVVIGLQREPTVKCGEAIERSGEELGPVRGILVGSSPLRKASSLLLRRFAIKVPREDASLSAVWENQERKSCSQVTLSVLLRRHRFEYKKRFDRMLPKV